MKFWAILLALMILASGLANVGFGQDDELILRVAMQDDLKTTNPLTAGDVWTWNVVGYLYDGPINVNPDTDELIPYIAVGSATTLADDVIDWSDCNIGEFDFTPASTWNSTIGEVIIFYDFENVYWHDGEQMDIRDIMFSMHVTAQVPEWSSSMNCLKDNGGRVGTNFSANSWLNIYKVWESADKKQAALKYVLTEPFADFFRNTASTFLLPYHIWGSTESGQLVDNAKIWCDEGYDIEAEDAWKISKAQEYENRNPVGNGPFEWDHWDIGQLSKITTWRDHFYKPGYKYEFYCKDADGKDLARQPNIDAMVFKIYKTAEAAVLALRNDDIDYIGWSVPPTFVQELASEPGVALQQSPERGFFYLAYNMRRQSFGYDEDKTFPYEPEDDLGKPFRRAVAHCIDKKRIVQRLLLNFGIAGTGPVSSISEWYNDSIPTYDFNPDKAIGILENASYIPPDWSQPVGWSGNHWKNPDGSEIGSGPNGIIEILTPEANYDPIQANKGLMISQQLVDIGIYAKSVAMDFGSIVDRIDKRDFDMYILGWRIGSDPTDFLHAFFHSSTAEIGQNYPGYQNQSFDELIGLARETEDEDIRLKAVKDAQASICYDLPFDVLYFRTNIEAYRSDRFTGWEVGSSGSIFNWGSIMNIRAPSPYKVKAQFVSAPSAIGSNETVPITIYVKNQDGEPLEGAHVIVNASAGAFSNAHGNTTTGGKVTFTYTAPYVDPSNPDTAEYGAKVILQIKSATYSDSSLYYDPASSQITMLAVYPEDVAFLSVTLSADPDVIDPDVNWNYEPGFTYIDVEVTDRDGAPVEGATVAIEVSPAIPDITPNEAITDADGKATFILTATDEPNDDDSIVQYTITAYAATDDKNVKPGDNSINVEIVDSNDRDPPPPPPPLITIFWNFIIVGVAIFLIVVAAVAIMARPEKVRKDKNKKY